jgi:penicillin-insensitive murein DD-endopeptidase
MSVRICHGVLRGAAAACLVQQAGVSAAESKCFGTVGRGHIDGSVKLPISGANFSAYSRVGAAAGRTHVHSKVAEIVTAAYASLAVASPEISYVYGETGWPSGGRIRPHRTHQNGLSVDFFVPVRDQSGRPARLPTDLSNRFGYDIEFDLTATYSGYVIDFSAMAEHLYRLHLAAEAHGAGIALVIVDPSFLPRLFATTRGPYLQRRLPLMKKQAWVRHDEHYHVDFAIPCKPSSAADQQKGANMTQQTPLVGPLDALEVQSMPAVVPATDEQTTYVAQLVASLLEVVGGERTLDAEETPLARRGRVLRTQRSATACRGPALLSG